LPWFSKYCCLVPSGKPFQDGSHLPPPGSAFRLDHDMTIAVRQFNSTLPDLGVPLYIPGNTPWSTHHRRNHTSHTSTTRHHPWPYFITWTTSPSATGIRQKSGKTDTKITGSRSHHTTRESLELWSHHHYSPPSPLPTCTYSRQRRTGDTGTAHENPTRPEGSNILVSFVKIFETEKTTWPTCPFSRSEEFFLPRHTRSGVFGQTSRKDDTGEEGASSRRWTAGLQTHFIYGARRETPNPWGMKSFLSSGGVLTAFSSRYDGETFGCLFFCGILPILITYSGGETTGFGELGGRSLSFFANKHRRGGRS